VTRPPIDLALDGSPGDEALLIDGVRLVVQPVGGEDRYKRLQRIFWMLCQLRDELRERRDWEKEVNAHIARIPVAPRRRIAP
jgi:hypothetical protein